MHNQSQLSPDKSANYFKAKEIVFAEDHDKIFGTFLKGN